jgi:hypothetical protein
VGVAAIDWESETVEPAQHGGGDQLSVAVRGADAGWSQRFSAYVVGHSDLRWGRVRWHEVEGLITVEDVRDDALGELREFLDRLTVAAQRS